MAYAGMIAQAAGGTLGTLLQLQGVNQTNKAEFDAYINEIRKQQGYASQAQQVLPGAISGVANFGPALAQNTAQRNQLYSQVGQTPLSVTRSQNPYSARDTSYLGLLGNQRATLGSYGDWMHSAGLALQDAQRKLSTISNFSQGELHNVYPYHLYDAQHAADTINLAAALIEASSNATGVGLSMANIGGQAPGYGNAYGPGTSATGLGPGPNTLDFTTYQQPTPYSVYGFGSVLPQSQIDTTNPNLNTSGLT